MLKTDKTTPNEQNTDTYTKSQIRNTANKESSVITPNNNTHC